MALFSCENVSIAFEHRLVVEKMSFSVQPGDFICIVGENGTGKSTLLRGILGLLPLSSGAVRFGRGMRQGDIGYLPQQTPVQKDFPASVYEIVLSGSLGRRGLLPFYTAQEKERAKKNLLRMGLWEKKSKSYRDLSGGQQQRVLLARALCATDKLLILDEPATGLDPHATHELYELVEGMSRDDGVAVLMVSHDIAYAVGHAKTILHMDKELLFFGSASDYRQSPYWNRLSGGGEE